MPSPNSLPYQSPEQRFPRGGIGRITEFAAVAAITTLGVVIVIASQSDWLDNYMYVNDMGKYKADYTPDKETGEIRPHRIPYRS
jgi:hypothetical protein